MSSFAIAEQYIQLKRKCLPKSWADTILRINEMILTPLITICLFFIGESGILSILPVLVHTYRAWKEWTQFSDLRFKMQKMYLQTLLLGGPFIVTNDPEYLPYVYADAITRSAEPHRSQTS